MKHTFVICAYKESPYLEECIRSLKSQTMASEIILTTSTPSEFLEKLCGKYDISYQVREGKSSIADDWNYAFSCARTPYVTIAHQDDIYYSDYAKEMIHIMESSEEPMIAFSDYAEYKNGKECKDGLNLKIKRILLSPIKSIGKSGRRFWKRWILRFGNAICCPSVTYNRAAVMECMHKEQRETLFLKHFRSNLDWETWEWLSQFPGQFLYIKKSLMAHRIHADSETTATIKEHKRSDEDYEMFCKFWPHWFARVLTGYYKKSEDSNTV